jgi:gamma-glutamyltranspeptidase/glutathione hydrolase
MQGDVAQAMVKLVQSHPVNPGQLSLTDLSGYRAIERAPLCHDYSAPSAFKSADASGQKLYRICGMPPPSSGAIAMGQILGLLQNTPAATLQPGLSAEWLHLYTEATRLALADRAVYLGDPDFVQAPSGNWMSLLAPTYLAARARQITERAMDLSTVRAGQPGGQPSEYAPMPNQLEYGTSHISIIDGNGNALAMTTTIEDAFGARLMVNRGRGLSGGFLLNNELTDFSFVPRDTSGRLIANRVQPGKRPRSSMSPTLVFDKASGKLVLSVGSPGGAFIINFVAKTLYASLNWNMTPQQAIALPNFGILEGTPLILEVQLVSASIREALKAKGHEILEVPLPSGLQGLALTADGLIGGADPRREGTVMGD